MTAQKPRSTKKVLTIAGATAGILGLTLGIWYFLASRQFTKLSGEVDRSLASLAEAHGKVMASPNQPGPMIVYQDALTYLAVFQAEEPRLRRAMQQLRTGEGMGFWLPEKRELHATAIQQHLDLEAPIIHAAQQTTKNTGELYALITKLREKTGQHRADAKALLNPESDIQDFQDSRETLKTSNSEISKAQRRISSALKKLHGEDLVQAMEESLLHGFAHSLEQESHLVKWQIEIVQKAGKQLTAYKGQLLTTLSGSNNLIQQLHLISQELYPAIRAGYQRSQPMLELIQKADEPIFKNEAANLLSSVFSRRGSSQPMSALDLISKYDPATAQAVKVVKGVCTGIETIHQETQGLHQATRLASTATRAFQNTRTRKAMLDLINASPNAASYLESKADIFNPVLSKTRQTRTYIQGLYRVASRVKIPAARNMIRNTAGLASRLLDATEAPFRKGKASIRTASRTLRSLMTLEKEYRASLGALSAQQVTPAQK